MPIAAGDMYGIKGIDHLAEPRPARPGDRRLVSERPVVLRAAAHPQDDRARTQLAAWNLPSGVIFDMLRDAAAKRPGVLTKVGLGTFVDPRLEGGRMNDAARPDIVRVVEFGGEEWLHFPNIAPACRHRPRHDRRRERQHRRWSTKARYLGDVDVALAARNSGGVVIAQVKRIAARGSIPPQRVIVPSTLVDFVVVDPQQKQATRDRLRSGALRRGAAPGQLVRAGALRSGQGDRPPRGDGAARRRRGQPGLRHLAAGALHPARGGPGRRGDLGDRAGRRSAACPLPGFPFGCAYNAQAILPSP